MSKTCARCEKTVYPIEELKCLDKIWHKQCFKCQGCGMTLNMRTYKGFNKQPYCGAHIPKAKATTMAVTPELTRIAENTKIQSNVKYHAEFEKAKGKFTQVADDPETMRVKQNSKIISNVAYHGELEKKAMMEQKRTMTGENGEQIEYVEYTDGTISPASSVNANPPAPISTRPAVQSPVQRTPGRIADYDPLKETRPSPYSARQAATTVIYTSDKGPVTNPPTRKIGSVADIDPVNEYYGSLTPATNNNYVQSSPPPPVVNTGRVYRAMYDYEAQDHDEVSFCDGDLIINCTAIDEGWMTGLVQRTGRQGMLPANYVEPAQI
ncbi:LIM and SH3 domain protein Lasp [Copidosoma floridanum]|uniref:LIM and SH3 domain protein Lasp n=1 Tax=Copidosoma floridanum TaxID=29053 RepID=UPI0006C9E166|nr:LIM and SH3 domain protein Lasp [Copidosoma floridanum]